VCVMSMATTAIGPQESSFRIDNWCEIKSKVELCMWISWNLCEFHMKALRKTFHLVYYSAFYVIF